MSSDDNNMEAKAQNQVPNNKQDDFDMVKLKKSLKQEQRRSMKQKFARLTPAEIRSLNHGGAFSESIPSNVRISDYRSQHGLASGTPPLTPDARSVSRSSVHQPQPERKSSSTLSTPPQSPSRERRGSNASSRHVVHAPKPMSGTQVAHLTNSGYLSRTPSASSYRGIATYRGPEVTRTGSLTMIAHPSPQIVANPLSQFSRPRQSTLTSQAPPRSNSDTQPSNDSAQPAHSTERHRSLGNPSAGLSRDHSPVRMSDSPVSMEDGKVPDKITVGPTLSKSVSAHDQPPSQPPSATANAGDEAVGSPTKQKLKWRKTFNGATESDQDLAPLRKEDRRRTFTKQTQCLHAIRYDDTKPGPQPVLRNTLKDELPSVKTSVFKGDAQNHTASESEYAQHPAVRPFSIDTTSSTNETSDTSPSSNKKGKEREVDTDMDSDQHSMSGSIPSYSRCSCCGRVQKTGFESELSPVMENENIRTNFDFEATRTSVDRKRRPSMNNSHKYTPIIPMEVGTEMKQARIEPMPEVPPVRNEPKPRVMGIVNKPGDVIGPGSIPLAIMPKTRTDPRLSRFGSLHARKDDQKEQEEKKRQEAARNDQATHQLQRFGSLYGIRNEAQSQSSPPVPPQPIQTAYQAQQAKHYSMPHVHRPVRSSRLAYHETADEVPIMDQFANQTPRYAPSVIRAPIIKPDTGVDGARVHRDDTTNDDNDIDDFAVDLSSFDGSFVHRSLSRAATHNASSPTTSYAHNGFREFHANDMNDSHNATVLPNESQNVQVVPSTQQPVQHPDTHIGVALSTPIRSSEALVPGREDWPLPSPDKDTFTPSINEPAQRLSTIVKIVPSAPISSSSSQKSANGQLRLGDWILPEGPKSLSAAPDSRAFGSVSSVATGHRQVAAA